MYATCTPLSILTTPCHPYSSIVDSLTHSLTPFLHTSVNRRCRPSFRPSRRPFDSRSIAAVGVFKPPIVEVPIKRSGRSLLTSFQAQRSTGLKFILLYSVEAVCEVGASEKAFSLSLHCSSFEC
ncbi:hypothetical protein L1987_21462 [Smallanthus sonchifolius]|uniref:Uncharacterized protein n=1 Tax=Smallanthus sonchifolius TaxID=185202 RepID=A0ACB9IU14_9ASTR|nr:hypothetical protein L1987_21462 [Smallanthus sonchifolius]